MNGLSKLDKMLLGIIVLLMLYAAFQPRIYRSHETGGRVITVQLPAGEAGYNSGLFYCQKGDC